MTGRLQDKTAIVTGGGSGFGAGIARHFAAAGARVMVADINHDAAKNIADEIGGIAIEVDVSDNHSMQAMHAAATAHFGTLDILVNNAGVTHKPQPMEDISEAEAGTGDALNGAIDVLNADLLRFRELDQDLLSIKGTENDLDRDLLADKETDGLASDPFADSSSASESAAEVAVASEITSDGVAVSVTTATTATGTAVQVAVPETSNAAIVIDANASVDATAAANSGANLIIIKPTP